MPNVKRNGHIHVACQRRTWDETRARSIPVVAATSWNSGQKRSAVKHRKCVQPRGYNSTPESLKVCRSTLLLVLSQTCLPQMDAALQPSALPAALSNTQVGKIKDTRCLVSQRTGLCSPSLIHTRKDSQLVNSASGEGEKK